MMVMMMVMMMIIIIIRSMRNCRLLQQTSFALHITLPPLQRKCISISVLKGLELAQAADKAAVGGGGDDDDDDDDDNDNNNENLNPKP